MHPLLQDFRYALRMLRKNAGLTLVIVLSLSIGIGANSAIFSVVDALLLRPLPYPNSGRLANIYRHESARIRGAPDLIAGADIAQRTRLRRATEAFDAVLARQPSFLPVYWHQHHLFCAQFLLAQQRTRPLRTGFLISPSRDGELGAMIMRRLGGHVIRGSSTRTGALAMKEYFQALMREQVSPVLNPDGPRGPRFKCKPGAVLLAQMSGRPLGGFLQDFVRDVGFLHNALASFEVAPAGLGQTETARGA